MGNGAAGCDGSGGGCLCTEHKLARNMGCALAGRSPAGGGDFFDRNGEEKRQPGEAGNFDTGAQMRPESGTATGGWSRPYRDSGRSTLVRDFAGNVADAIRRRGNYRRRVFCSRCARNGNLFRDFWNRSSWFAGGLGQRDHGRRLWRIAYSFWAADRSQTWRLEKLNQAKLKTKSLGHEAVRNPARALPVKKEASAAELDPVIHERMRLGIISALAAREALTFSELKRLLEATDGNLSVHARKLEEANYIVCAKSFNGRVPRTEYRITPSGRRALERYLDQMEQIIRQTRGV